MKRTLTILGILLFLSGLVWFLQGLNILLGSPMSGDSRWVTNGGIAMLVGAGLFWWGSRKQA